MGDRAASLPPTGGPAVLLARKQTAIFVAPTKIPILTSPPSPLPRSFPKNLERPLAVLNEAVQDKYRRSKKSGLDQPGGGGTTPGINAFGGYHRGAVMRTLRALWELLRFSWRARDRRRAWPLRWLPWPSPEYRYLRLRTYYGQDFPAWRQIVKDTILFGHWLRQLRPHVER